MDADGGNDGAGHRCGLASTDGEQQVVAALPVQVDRAFPTPASSATSSMRTWRGTCSQQLRGGIEQRIGELARTARWVFAMPVSDVRFDP